MVEDVKPDYKKVKDAYKQAIPGSYGILSLIAERLNLHRGAVTQYVQRHKDIEELINQEREKQIDAAEGVIFNKMRGRDFEAAKYVASRLGKHRGWTEKTEIEDVGKNKVQKIKVEIIDRTTPKNDSVNEGTSTE